MHTTFSYDHYYLQDEIESNIKALSEKYPDIFAYEYLLETQDKHHVIAVTLTNKATGAACDKPAFYIDGNTHAGEVTGMMAAMHTMDVLATNYGSDERVTFILDNMAVYIIPCVSPDGSQTYLTTPYTLRSVNRPYYEHETGLAVDINTADTADHFENTKEYAWLIENCYKYGYILRYLPEKEYLTGYIYEPWHYRYVGVDYAQKIMESGLTFEEWYALNVE